ncbi:sigma-70-like protein [Lentzea atacamensis]|uniref:Sigma-70-like protein n=2 Tax=Lentzea atacamensis TaxID=531938 RepID=A0A316HDE5_9PSEU|nr:sigma-70-like protein [Lentzea atacamensis]
MRNLHIDRARARARRPLEVADICDNTQRDHADEILLSMTVTAMLDVLRPQDREVLEHVYLRDFTLSQAAHELNIPRARPSPGCAAHCGCSGTTRMIRSRPSYRTPRTVRRSR